MEYWVKGNKHHTYYSPSSEAYEAINMGYPLIVRYDSENPARNTVSPSQMDSLIISNHEMCVGTVSDVLQATKLNFIYNKETFQ